MEKFAFLERYGFHRAPALEETTSLLGTVVFLGGHVGFIVSVDLRDKCVDTRVVEVVDGHVRDNLAGGYSSDLFLHLVKHRGYRGRPAGTVGAGSRVFESALERMVDGSARLLSDAGESLLRDTPESLPWT